MIKKLETMFDTSLSQIPHYKQLPSLMSFIGRSYSLATKKVLFIGKSHYLPENSTINYSPEYLYSDNNIAILKEEKVIG